MDGKSVSLSRRATLSVRLPSNATTGYSWAVAGRPAVLKQLGDTYSGPSRPIAGAGGTQILIFRPIRTGRGVLRLAYRRPWEKEWRPPAETFRLTIIVR